MNKILIQIRRNRSMTMMFNASKEQKEALSALFQEYGPTATPEVRQAQDKSAQIIKDIENQTWKYIAEHPMKDLSGNQITPETHELCYDTEPREIEGQTVIVATQFYIQPKESEIQ